MRDLLPIGIYTIPEISFVGKTEQQLTEEDAPYEVGVAYYGRSYEEGKKITWKDGVKAIRDGVAGGEFTAREVEMAERKKAIELIGSRQVAEREALRLTSAARAAIGESLVPPPGRRPAICTSRRRGTCLTVARRTRTS